MTSPDQPLKTVSYEFLEFRLDGAKKELWAGNEPVDVQRRVFDLLFFLLENRDRTLSKDELQDAVWPGTIVTEAALSRAIMKARKALGDDAANPRVIKTVHGQGYRFVAEAQLVDLDGERAEGDPVELTVSAGTAPVGIDTEARRASVLRVATTYGAVAWLINQAAAMVWEAFEWDKLPIQALLAISLLGFPIAVGVAWFYRSTTTGLRLRSESSPAGTTSGGGWAWSVAGILALALGLSLFWNARSSSAEASFDQVAVLPLRNDTGESSLAWTELGLMGLLNTALSEADVATVTPTEVLRLAPTPGASVDADLAGALAAQAGAGKALSMQLLRSGDVYVLRSHLFEDGRGQELPSFTAPTPSEAAVALAGYLRGYLRPSYQSRSDAFASQDAFVDQAFARGMHEMISGNLADARDLLEVARAGAPKSFWPAYELAVVRQKLGDLDQARVEFERLLAMRGDAARPREVARAHNALGIIADLTGRLDDAETHYALGLAAAEQARIHDVRAVLWVNAAVASRALGKPGEAQERLGRARSAYAAAGVEVLHGDFFVTLGNVSADAGDIEGARQGYLQALEHARLRQTPEVEGIALSNLSWAAQHLGRYDEAASYLEESEALRERIGDRVGVLRSRIRRATLAFSRGKLDQANDLADELLADDYAATELDLQSTALAVKGEVALALGQSGAALDHFDAALAIEQAGGTRFGLLRSLLGRSRALAEHGDLEQSQAALDAMQAANNDSDPMAVFELRGHRQAARLQGERGELDAAEQTLRLAIDGARSTSDTELANLAADLSELLIERGDIAGAETFVGLAIDAAPNTPEVLVATARLARALGDIERVDRLVNEVRALSGERFGQELAALSSPFAKP